jgi:hypothetical protein
VFTSSLLHCKYSAGYLLFCPCGLILILLEGAHEDVADYLVRARTMIVDVDTKGRKVSSAQWHLSNHWECRTSPQNYLILKSSVKAGVVVVYEKRLPSWDVNVLWGGV